MFTDTERLDFILEYFHIDDIGDDIPCIGVVCRYESLESALQQPGIAYGCDVRDLIDMAIMEVEDGN